MKHKAPQPDFPWAEEPFALRTDSAIDGERIVKEREETAAAKAGLEKQQSNFLDERDRKIAEITQGRTIWNSDGTDGPCPICFP